MDSFNKFNRWIEPTDETSLIYWKALLRTLRNFAWNQAESRYEGT